MKKQLRLLIVTLMGSIASTFPLEIPRLWRVQCSNWLRVGTCVGAWWKVGFIPFARKIDREASCVGCRTTPLA